MSEVPLFPLWVTVLVYIWAPIGPIVGILIGHVLLTSWERKRWLADNRKDEYRRVLIALNKLNILMVDWHDGNGPLEPIKAAMDEFVTALNTSLFVHEFFERTKVVNSIRETVSKLLKRGSFDDYHKEYWKAVNLIVDAAQKSAL
jgi:hypothetical protein